MKIIENPQMDTLFWEEILTKFAQKWVCINHQIRKLDSLVTQKTHFLCEVKTCQNSYFCKVLLCDRGPRHIISDECPCTIKSNSRRFPENLLPWRSENLPKLFKVLWYYCVIEESGRLFSIEMIQKEAMKSRIF